MGLIAVADCNNMLDAYCRSVTYTGHANVWCQLHIGDPGSAGTANVAANTTRKQAAFSVTPASASVSNSASATWTSVPNAETYTHVSLWSTSTSGTFIGSDNLANAAPVSVGNTFTIPLGQIVITLTNSSGVIDVAEFNGMLHAYVHGNNYTGNNGLWLKLHTGDPGAAGTTNAALNTTRQRAIFATAGSGGSISNTSAVTWTPILFSETYTHVSAWTSVTGGTFVGSASLSSAAAVTTIDTFQINIGAFTVTLA